MAIVTVDDLIAALSKFDGSKLVKVQDREIPVIALNASGVYEDVFLNKDGKNIDIVLITVQRDLDESQGR